MVLHVVPEEEMVALHVVSYSQFQVMEELARLAFERLQSIGVRRTRTTNRKSLDVPVVSARVVCQGVWAPAQRWS